jgi:chemotaxis protein MotB
MEGSKPIIIIKKKGGHGGHHGGAWKVAYADFVTAMMALFIVLWLLNTSKPVREAIAGYFKDPSGTAGKLGTTIEGKGEVVVAPKKEDMDKLKQELEKAISQMPDFDKLRNQIEITVTAEGCALSCSNPQPEHSSTSAARNPMGTAKNCFCCWQESWENCRTRFRLKGTPTRSPLAVTIPITAIGNSRPTEPIRRDA